MRSAVKLQTNLVRVLKGDLEGINPLLDEYPPALRSQSITDAIRIVGPLVGRQHADLREVVAAISMTAFPVESGKISVAIRLHHSPDLIRSRWSKSVVIAPGVIVRKESPRRCRPPLFDQLLGIRISEGRQLDIGNPRSGAYVADRVRVLGHRLDAELTKDDGLPRQFRDFPKNVFDAILNGWIGSVRQNRECRFVD